jgi:hypothetical protein
MGPVLQEETEVTEKSGLIGSWENQAVNVVLQDHGVIIDEQTQGNVEELHIAQELGLVDREDLFDALAFHEKATVNEDVEAKGLIEYHSLVLHTDDALRLR